MTILHAGALVIVLAAIAFAVADVFWPITVAVALGVALGWWFGHLAYVYAPLRPWMFAAYVAAGFAWTFFKWTRLVERAYQEDRHRARNEFKAGPPKWSAHSYDFAAYFFYWPLDVIAYVLSDFLRDAWRYISAMIGKSFDRYAEWRFRGRQS